MGSTAQMGSMSRLTIALVRHGETAENVAAIIQGQLDTKLNETGLRQAQMLGPALAKRKFARIYSSDLSRAHETARQILLATNQSDQSKIESIDSRILNDTRLRERNFGSIQGESLETLHRLAREANTSVVEYTPSDGGETLADVRRRVVEFVDRRLIEESIGGDEEEEGDVLIVSHGGVIRDMITYFRSFGHHSFREHSDRCRLVPPNTSVSEFVIHLERDHRDSTPARTRIATIELVRLHDISHMDEKLRHQALNQKQVNAKNGPAI